MSQDERCQCGDKIGHIQACEFRKQNLTNTSSLPTDNKPQRDYILLDASGSMSTRWWESLEALDSYVATLSAQNVGSQITLATFTSGGGRDLAYDKCRESTPQEWKSLVSDSPGMWAGSTPLYDSINVMVRELKDLDPPKCRITIVTDGDENTSKTSLAQAKALLDWCRAKGWQVNFMGCDFDNSQQARMLGANASNSIGTSAKRLKDATAELAKKAAHHAHFGTPMNFSDEERERFGGYLSAPNGN